MRRVDELRRELCALLSSLPQEAWALARPGKWSVRTLVDHIANSQWLIAQSLEEWPETPREAHAVALQELLDALEPWVEASAQRRTDHFGHNSENGRVTWTPRKVARVVGAMQRAWLDHALSGAPAPGFPLAHDDQEGDDAPPRSTELAAVAAMAAELAAAVDDRTIGLLARRNRYYARRLHVWPDGTLARWDAVWEHSKALFLSFSPGDLARVWVDPTATLTTVRQALGLSLGHMREHARHVRLTLELHGLAG